MTKTMEANVVEALQKSEYTLNTVNSYGENILHISVANGCFKITKEILRKHNSDKSINKKNKFGWSPLMLAIRNKDVRTVKYLLENNANVNDSTYLGMSVLGFAAAINKDMFEIVYKKCPSALLNSVNDDITPLCVAALKNDKTLFFRLIELGFDVSKSNEYTHIIMKQSTIPEIRNLAKQIDIENYWNDTSDNILVEDESEKIDKLDSLKSINKSGKMDLTKKIHKIANKCDNEGEDISYPSNVPIKPMISPVKPITDDCNNNVISNANKNMKPHILNLMTNELELDLHNLISPRLTCVNNDMLPASPNIYFTQDQLAHKKHDTENIQISESETENKTCSNNHKSVIDPTVKRLQSIRPPDLVIEVCQEDLDTSLGYVPEYSPQRSPNVPPDINDETVFGEDTPTPPCYKTPPRGMILNSEETKMFVLLKHYGLSQHLSTFLEQEVDIDLFMTLSDEDLIEIGISNEQERKDILNVIEDYKKTLI